MAKKVKVPNGPSKTGNKSGKKRGNRSPKKQPNTPVQSKKELLKDVQVEILLDL